jgi:hypothetical protein
MEEIKVLTRDNVAFVSYPTTGNSKDFHIYEKALFKSDFSYIQKILGNFQGFKQNKKVDYIYYLYISLSFILSISLFLVATFFRIKGVLV